MNKRFFALLISTTLLVLLTALSPARGSAKPLYGDANKDGTVDCIDATYIKRYLINLADIDEDTLPYVIVSGEDELSIVDACLIQRYDIMLISEFPIERMQRDIDPAHDLTEAIPEYVRTEADRVSQIVESHQSEDSFSFLAISDMHYREDYINIKNGITHAGMGMELIRNSVPIDAGVVLGDNGWQSQEETLEEGLEQIKTANSLIDNSMSGIPNFRTPGNHCSQIGSYRKYRDYHRNADLYPFYGAYNTGAVFDEDNRRRGYCYRDFNDKKLRVIVLNTSDLEEQAPKHLESMNISAAQLRWLISALDVSDKPSPSEWQILLLSHAPLDWNAQTISSAEILAAYQNGTSGTVSKDGEQISYDFSGTKRGSIIAQIHGHIHDFKVDDLRYPDDSGSKTFSTGIKRVSIPNACYSRNNEYNNGEYEYLDIDYGEEVTYRKVAQTARDTSFCVVTIDLQKRTVYADCYGSGYDRVVRY